MKFIEQDDGAVTTQMRKSSRFMRSTSLFALLTFGNAILFPTVLAAQEAITNSEETIVIEGSVDQQVNQTLQNVQSNADETHTTIQERLAEEQDLLEQILDFLGLSTLTMEDNSNFEMLYGKMNELHEEALRQFDDTHNMLVEKNIDASIIAKNDQAKADFEGKFSALKLKLEAVLAAQNLVEQGAAIEDLSESMKTEKLQRSHSFSDPGNLPWGTPDAEKTRPPETTETGLESHTKILPYYKNASVLIAANEIPAGMLEGSNGGPLPEDLSENIEVEFTQAIKDKAAELEHDPVKIYNWVRNNIEFIPSYGSIQGADYTLQSGKANAMDSASLLIALLRASNVPARYAYGSVEIPVEEVMNWVGGVDVAGAAQQLLGQGGIPNVAIVDAGEVKSIRIEHTWVEAWIDYYPSRAAKHKVGDSWIPLDASFKQYQYTKGINPLDNISFDAEGLVEQLNASATVNEVDGYVQGGDKAAIETALKDFQLQVEDFIVNQDPSTTVGDVLATQKVIQQESLQLASGLPYYVIAQTDSYSELPNNLRHKFKYTLGLEYYGQENSRLITFERTLPEVAGRRLALSYRPETEADEELVASYTPEPDAVTGEVDTSLFPASLPGYLIGLTAEFTMDGETVQNASAGNMGSELYETMALYSPGHGWSAAAVNHPLAGEYRAIGLDLQGVNTEEADRLKAKVESTKAKLESDDAGQFSTLTKQDLVGDLFYATIYSYFALNNLQDRIQSQASNIVQYRLPSFGLFTPSLQVSYWYGTPRNVSFSGLVMDVDHVASQLTAVNDSKEARLAFMRNSGIRLSAMEHLVPEQIFSTDQHSAFGISAVKAIDLAAAEGQKIWTITHTNLDQALTDINLSAEIESEIRNSVYSGKVVTTHQRHISYYGSSAAGYIIIDPETGAGAYKISSGENGGVLLLMALAFLEVAVLFFVASSGLAIALGVAIVISNLLVMRSFDNPIDMAGGAAVSYITLVLSFILLTILFQATIFVGIPLSFLLSVIASAVGAMYLIIRSFYASSYNTHQRKKYLNHSYLFA